MRQQPFHRGGVGRQRRAALLGRAVGGSRSPTHELLAHADILGLAWPIAWCGSDAMCGPRTCTLRSWTSRLHRQIARSAPAGALAAVVRKAESAGGSVLRLPLRLALSQTCVCGAHVRKPLSQRVHVCAWCGLRMQRDLLSAYLARCCDGTAAAADHVREAWPATEPLLRTARGGSRICETSRGGNASEAPRPGGLGRSGSCARPGPWSPPTQHAVARGTPVGRPEPCMAGWIRPREFPDDRQAGPRGTIGGPGRIGTHAPIAGRRALSVTVQPRRSACLRPEEDDLLRGQGRHQAPHRDVEPLPRDGQGHRTPLPGEDGTGHRRGRAGAPRGCRARSRWPRCWRRRSSCRSCCLRSALRWATVTTSRTP